MASLIGTFPSSSRVENVRHGEFYSLFKFLTRRNVSVSGQTGSELTNANSTFLSIILFFLSVAFWTAVCGDAEEDNRTVWLVLSHVVDNKIVFRSTDSAGMSETVHCGYSFTLAPVFFHSLASLQSWPSLLTCYLLSVFLFCSCPSGNPTAATETAELCQGNFRPSGDNRVERQKNRGRTCQLLPCAQSDTVIVHLILLL